MILLSLSLSSGFAAAAGCQGPLDGAALDASLEGAMSAWVEVDEVAFHASVDALRAGVPCLSEPLRPEQAARLHRVLGISAASAGDLEGAALSFAAARSADPSVSLPVPEKHPLLAVFASVDVSAAARAPLAAPHEGALVVDGAASAERVEAWPAVVQWVVGDEVRRSELLEVGEAPAAWPAPPALVEAPPPEELPLPRGNWARDLPKARIVAAGGAAALAGGLWLGSAVQASRFEAAGAELTTDPSGATAQLTGARRGANALGAAALGSAAAAAGLGLSVVFTF